MQAVTTWSNHPILSDFYGPVGNRLASTKGTATTSSSYDKADPVPGADGNGNEVDGTAYGYDQANRLTSAATIPATSYGYNGDGARTTVTDVGTVTTVYDPNRALRVALVDRAKLRRVYSGLDQRSRGNRAKSPSVE